MTASAHAKGLRMTLATVAAGNCSEAGAALAVLSPIGIKGRIVTSDSQHRNCRMAAKRVVRGGNSCETLKGNQQPLVADARPLLGKMLPSHSVAEFETTEHGRSKMRVAIVVAVKRMTEDHAFPGLKAFGRNVSRPGPEGEVEMTERFLALSGLLQPATLLAARRSHGDIESALPWSRDVVTGGASACCRKAAARPIWQGCAAAPATSPPTFAPTVATGLRSGWIALESIRDALAGRSEDYRLRRPHQLRLAWARSRPVRRRRFGSTIALRGVTIPA